MVLVTQTPTFQSEGDDGEGSGPISDVCGDERQSSDDQGLSDDVLEDDDEGGGEDEVAHAGDPRDDANVAD